eukprot:jgi/Picsp_1/4939/NSC_02303-R1_hypothetical zinc finger protein
MEEYGDGTISGSGYFEEWTGRRDSVEPVGISDLREMRNGVQDGEKDVRRKKGANQDGRAQICFDFTKGQCSRGDGCKYSHDVNYIIEVNSQEKGICFDYLKGTCARGMMCRFSHDLNNLKPLLVSQARGEYIGQGKKKGPICYDFVKNKCAKGSDCKYSHDYTALFQQIHKKRPSSGKQQQQPRAPNHFGAGTGQDTVCIDFLRGRCTRGNACRYKHTIPGTMGQAATGNLVPSAPVSVPPGFGCGVDTNQATLENLLTNLRLMKFESEMKKKGWGLDESSFQGCELEDHVFGLSYPPATAAGKDEKMDAFYEAFLKRKLQEDSRFERTMCEESKTYQSRAQSTAMLPDTLDDVTDIDAMLIASSPPLTHAEKRKMAMRHRLYSNESDTVDSPTIGAGWSHNKEKEQSRFGATANGGCSVGATMVQSNSGAQQQTRKSEAIKGTIQQDLVSMKSIWSDHNDRL